MTQFRSRTKLNLETWNLVGPIAGGPFPPEQPNPRSVSVEFFNEVCPEERRVRVNIHEMKEGLEWWNVPSVLDKYVEMMKSIKEGCVELYGDKYEHPFDFL